MNIKYWVWHIKYPLILALLLSKSCIKSIKKFVYKLNRKKFMNPKFSQWVGFILICIIIVTNLISNCIYSRLIRSYYVTILLKLSSKMDSLPWNSRTMKKIEMYNCYSVKQIILWKPFYRLNTIVPRSRSSSIYFCFVSLFIFRWLHLNWNWMKKMSLRYCGTFRMKWKRIYSWRHLRVWLYIFDIPIFYLLIT